MAFWALHIFHCKTIKGSRHIRNWSHCKMILHIRDSNFFHFLRVKEVKFDVAKLDCL